MFIRKLLKFGEFKFKVIKLGSGRVRISFWILVLGNIFRGDWLVLRRVIVDVAGGV